MGRKFIYLTLICHRLRQRPVRPREGLNENKFLVIPSGQLGQHGGGQQTDRRREEAPGDGEGGGGGELAAGGLRDAVSPHSDWRSHEIRIHALMIQRPQTRPLMFTYRPLSLMQSSG